MLSESVGIIMIQGDAVFGERSDYKTHSGFSFLRYFKQSLKSFFQININQKYEKDFCTSIIYINYIFD